MAVGSAAADPRVICSRRHPSRQNGVRSETTERPSPTGPRKTVRGRSVGGTSRSRTTNGSSVVSRLSRSRPTRLPVTTGTGPVASRPATSDAEVPGVHCSFQRPTRARRVVSRTEKTGPGCGVAMVLPAISHSPSGSIPRVRPTVSSRLCSEVHSTAAGARVAATEERQAEEES